ENFKNPIDIRRFVQDIVIVAMAQARLKGADENSAAKTWIDAFAARQRQLKIEGKEGLITPAELEELVKSVEIDIIKEDGTSYAIVSVINNEVGGKVRINKVKVVASGDELVGIEVPTSSELDNATAAKEILARRKGVATQPLEKDRIARLETRVQLLEADALVEYINEYAYAVLFPIFEKRFQDGNKAKVIADDVEAKLAAKGKAVKALRDKPVIKEAVNALVNRINAALELSSDNKKTDINKLRARRKLQTGELTVGQLTNLKAGKGIAEKILGRSLDGSTITIERNLTELAAIGETGIQLAVENLAKRENLGSQLTVAFSIYHEKLHDMLRGYRDRGRIPQTPAKKAPTVQGLEKALIEEIFIVSKTLEYLYSNKITPKERKAYFDFLKNNPDINNANFTNMAARYEELREKKALGKITEDEFNKKVPRMIATYAKKAFARDWADRFGPDLMIEFRRAFNLREDARNRVVEGTRKYNDYFVSIVPAPVAKTTPAPKAKTTPAPKVTAPTAKVTTVPKAKTTPTPKAKTTPAPAITSSTAKVTTVPKSKTTPTPEAKITPALAITAPVAKVTPASVAKTTPAPETKTTPASAVTVPTAKVTIAPAAKTTSPPEAKTTPAPETKTTPAPEAKTTPAPEAKTAPAPETKTTPAPEIKTTPAPETKITPAPETKTTPAPEVKTTPAPAVTVPTAKVTPAPEVKTTPAPEVKTTPAPAVTVPIAKVTPTPEAKTTPAPAITVPIAKITPVPEVAPLPASQQIVRHEVIKPAEKPKADLTVNEGLQNKFTALIEKLKTEDPNLANRDNKESAIALFEEAFKNWQKYGLRKSQKYSAQIMADGKFVIMEVGGGKTYAIDLAAFMKIIMARARGEDAQPYIMTTSDQLALEAADVAGNVLSQFGLKVAVFQMEGKTVGTFDVKTGELKFNESLEDTANAWIDSDLVIGTKSSLFFPIGQALIAETPLQEAVLERQHELLIDENDRIMVQEISESHMISSDRARIDAKEIENIQKDADKIAVEWKNDSRYYIPVKGTKSVKITEEGRKELVRRLEGILKGKTRWEKIRDDLRYVYYLKMALEARYCHEAGAQGDYVLSKDGTDVVITDEASGQAKPGSEWTDLHNAIRIKEGIPVKVSRYTLISIPFPELVPGEGKICHIKTKYGRPLVTMVTGATGTDASKSIKDIYGFDTESVLSEAFAERIIEHVVSGKGVVMHARKAQDAMKSIDSLKKILGEYKAEDLEYFVRDGSITAQALLDKMRELILDRLDTELVIEPEDTASVNAAIEGIVNGKKFGIVIAAEEAIIKDLRKAIAAKAIDGQLALVGRLTFPTYIYKTAKGRLDAGNQKIKELYDETSGGRKPRSIIVRVKSIRAADEKRRELATIGIDETNIIIIDAKNANTPEDLETLLSPALNRTGMIAIVAGNIINRGVNTRMQKLLQEEGAWLTGVNFYYDKYAAEASQLEGRFGRSGDAGEMYNYICVDDVMEMAPEGSSAHAVLGRLKRGETEDPLPESETLDLFDKIREMNEQRTIDSAVEENKFLAFRHMPHSSLTITGTAPDGTETERAASIWELFFDKELRDIRSGDFLETYLNQPYGKDKTLIDVVIEKISRVVKDARGAKGETEAYAALATAMEREFNIKFKAAADIPKDLIYNIITNGSEAVADYIRTMVMSEAMAIARGNWEDFFTKGLEDTKKYLSQAESEWVKQASASDLFSKYADIPVSAFGDMQKNMASEISQLLEERFGKLNVAVEAQAVAPKAAGVAIPATLRKIAIPGALGAAAITAVVLAFTHFLVPWVAIAIVIASLVLAYSAVKANIKFAAWGLLSSAGIFTLFRVLSNYASVDGTGLNLFGNSAGFLTSHPVLIAVIALVLVSSIILSNALSPHIKKIDAQDKSKQDLAISLANFKMDQEIIRAGRPIIQQILKLTNSFLPLLATTAAIVMAASGTLSLIGIPLAGSFGITLLASAATLALLGLISRMITVYIFNRGLLKATKEKPLELKSYQQLTGALMRGLILFSGALLILQLTGVPAAMLMIPVTGFISSIMISMILINPGIKEGVADKRARSIGWILVLPAMMGVVALVYFTGGFAAHMWAIGLISSALFGVSGLFNIAAIIRDVKHYVASRSLGKENIEGYGSALDYFIKQHVVMNIMAVTQALIGLVG
ncbi:MAG: hypothetical protein Q8O01_06130, partial [Candidatus Omnitrophota bacterium]|nr:hypothetical protein [Candidatus Omnitrophota bacterium]